MPLPAENDANADQIAYWNGPGGQRWAERQEAQDVLLAPVSRILLERIAAKPGDRVLDIGCGCGGLAIALAQQVAPDGSVLGADISAPMLDRARAVTPAGLAAEFVLADATVHPFVPASFDLMVSRFGVMFFADPVTSFGNIRRALKPGGRVVFACWREPKANPWMIAPLQAVYRHVPKLPEMAPEDPGPFAFASEARVTRILGEAGFSDVALEAHALALDIARGQGLDAAVQSAFEIGPASRALEGHPADTREAARQSVRELLAQYQDGDSVTLSGSIWLVTARA
ncbi:class I SAM-dependent methyltransferase [Bradyrhizobium sp. HKCCYLS20291]|uniref:class I SAM-dependent methyltransferase n=1 Tax=Bradyrhizobium sp. HKCCYLS20291 TaxID=3420766 RepID=UPI003EBCC8C4